MSIHLWLNHGFSSQRDLARAMRAEREARAGTWRLLLSHRHPRTEILGEGDAALLEPALEGDAYADWALDVAARFDVRGMLGVQRREDLLAAADRFAAAGIRLAAGACDAATLELCDDKDAFTQAMAAQGFPVARSIAVADATALAAALEVLADAGPLCVKPVRGIYGMGFWRLEPKACPFAAFANPDARRVRSDSFLAAYAQAEAPQPLLAMEYLPGPETSIDCLVDRGTLLAAAGRRKESGRQWVVTEGAALDLAERVAAALRLDGLVNIQTRVHADGTERLLEVNTRPSGGVAYSRAAGIDLGAATARFLLGERPTTRPRLTAPVAVRAVVDAIALPEMPELEAPLAPEIDAVV